MSTANLKRFKEHPFTPDEINTSIKWKCSRITRGALVTSAGPHLDECKCEIIQQNGLPILEITHEIDQVKHFIKLDNIQQLTCLQKEETIGIKLDEKENLYMYVDPAHKTKDVRESFRTIRYWGKPDQKKDENVKPSKVVSGFKPQNSLANISLKAQISADAMIVRPVHAKSASKPVEDPSPFPKPLPNSSHYRSHTKTSHYPSLSKSQVNAAPFRNTSIINRPSITPQFEWNGFKNSGQTCYINATLQLLFNLNHVRKRLQMIIRAYEKQDSILSQVINSVYPKHSFEDTLIYILAKVFESKQTKKVVDPSNLKKCMAKISSQFGNDDQEDAHELLFVMLEQIESEMEKVGKGMAELSGRGSTLTDPINSLFMGQVEEELVCKTCHVSRKRLSLIKGLSLDLPEPEFSQNGGFTLSQLLSFNFASKDLEYRCEEEDCEGKEATLHNVLHTLPKIFLLHAKRYVQTLTGNTIKRKEAIVIKESIDLGRWSSTDVQDAQEVMALYFGNISTSPPKKHHAKEEVQKIHVTDLTDDVDPIVEDPGDSLFFGTKNHSKPSPSLQPSSELDEYPTPSKKMKREVVDLTEDEQLEMALKASMTSTEHVDEEMKRAMEASLQDLQDEDLQLQRALRESMSHQPSPINSELDLFQSELPSEAVERVEKWYGLDAVILHFGSHYSSGHYVTDAHFARGENGPVWKQFNDDRTSIIGKDWQDVVKKNPDTLRTAYIMAFTQK